MKPAPCSWRVRISLILAERDRLSRKARFSSPGTPKTYSTPSSSRHWMKRSDALVMEVLVGVVKKAGRMSPGLLLARSDDAVGQHRIGHFLEAGDVCAADIVDIAVIA